jgi:hypothetical protein
MGIFRLRSQEKILLLIHGALEGYLGLANALSKGALPSATRERIAPAVAAINGQTTITSDLASFIAADVAAALAKRDERTAELEAKIRALQQPTESAEINRAAAITDRPSSYSSS